VFVVSGVHVLISEAFETYRSVLVFKNMSKKTEESYVVTARMLIVFFGDIHINKLTFELIRLWKLKLEQGRSPDTVRGYVICLRQVLRHCRTIGIPVIDPDSIPVPKRKQTVPTFISAQEVADFIEVAGKSSRGYATCNRLRNQAIISLLYASDIRASELCSLNRDSIKDNRFTVVGKGGRARLCFIDQRSIDLIKTSLMCRADSNPALFVSKSGKRIRTTNLQTMFRELSDRAGLTTPIHPHTLRHSFATNLLQNNANMRYVQEMMGHSSLATTQMYTHVVNNDLESIYKKYHSV